MHPNVEHFYHQVHRLMPCAASIVYDFNYDPIEEMDSNIYIGDVTNFTLDCD